MQGGYRGVEHPLEVVADRAFVSDVHGNKVAVRGASGLGIGGTGLHKDTGEAVAPQQGFLVPRETALNYRTCGRVGMLWAERILA